MDSTPMNIKLKRPDKIIMAVIAAVVACVLGYGLYLALPYLIALMANTITFVAELVVLVLMLMVVCDKGLWTAVYYKWANISRNMRRSVARENPIGTMDTAISRRASKLVEIDKNLTEAIGAKKRHEKNIAVMEKKSADEDAMALAAQQQQRSALEVQRHAVAAGRWAKAANDAKPTAIMFAEMQEKLEQARDITSNTLEDMKNQREVFAFDYDVKMSATKTLRGIRGFFTEDKDMEMLRMSIDEYERQTSEAEAEIDQFIRQITPAIEDADIKKQAEVQAAMERFGQKFLNASAAQGALPAASESTKVLAMPAAKVASK